jgi:uncharacterized protein
MSSKCVYLCAKQVKMFQKLIGRKPEVQILQSLLTDGEAELVSVIGRRRVGKTFLIRSVYQDRLDFDLSGTQKEHRKTQLTNFASQLQEYTQSSVAVQPPADWTAAFMLLRQYLQKRYTERQQRMVVFFDELPWLSGKNSGFLEAFGYFWNSWASMQNLVVVICGSSASWMIKKVLRDKGGLHNRVTKRLSLKPFTLAEAEAFLQDRGVYLDRSHLLEVYMAMGGIPHYLKSVSKGQSASQIISQVCFSENGLLRDEFPQLFSSLFEHANYHSSIVRVLAAKLYGLARNEIVEAIGVTNSGRISEVLDELTESGFITAYQAFGNKKKDRIFRLTDEYSLFYLRFIEPHLGEQDPAIWTTLSQKQTYKIWCGYAFENICLRHVLQIKNGLGIGGLYAPASTFYRKATETTAGVQIDLVLDRSDQIVNLLEIKYHATQIAFGQADADALRQRQQAFLDHTATRKMLHWVHISPQGLKSNLHTTATIAHVLNSDVLFIDPY